MEYPLIDSRDKDAIKEYIRYISAIYVPEWNNTEDGKDVGDALVDVFSSIYSETVQHVNQMPFINYIHFLNCIRVKLFSGSSASGYVTVELNDGVEPGVYIKKGTQLFVDKGEEAGQVLYESEHDCFAVDNQVNHIFYANGHQNLIMRPWSVEDNLPMQVKLFQDDEANNLQNHAVYFSSDDIFNISQGGCVDIELLHRSRKLQMTDLAAKLADPIRFSWMMLTEQGWQAIEHVASAGSRVQLTIKQELPLKTHLDREGRWICCQYKHGKPLEDILVEDVRSAAKAEGIVPEILMYNDLQLENHNLLPFGESFSIYDDFYIGCEEVLTKKGAHVEMVFQMAFKRFTSPSMIDEDGMNWKLIMREDNFKQKPPLDIVIEEVVWEYWNGDGWARLVFDEHGERMFSREQDDIQKVSLSFICPEDTAMGYVNAHYNYWIRARIRKVRNAYKQHVLYRCPIIERLELSYQYHAEMRELDYLITERNLETNGITITGQQDFAIFQRQMPEERAIYFCMQNPITRGPIAIYFSIKQQLQQPSLPLRWEYFAVEGDRSRWTELKVSDGTNMLSQSGLVVMTGKTTNRKATFFAQEGFWIRLVCIDAPISSNEKTTSELSGVYFNTIKIQQQETYPIEYFSIEPHEANRVCKLTGDNLIWQEVWVDEYESLSEQQWKQIVEDNQYQTKAEYDDLGNVVSRWILWQPIEDILLAGGNDRCYMMDAYYGKIQFGDGKSGRIPTAGSTDTIKILYQSGKGEQGNLEREELTSFADAIPFVKSVYNVEPIIGGTPKESIENALVRGPARISGRDSIVTIDDYVKLIEQADRNIVKVRCLRHQNPQGQVQAGALTVAILPIFYNQHINYFATIHERVMEVMQHRAPSIVTNSDKLYIVETQYLEYNLEIQLTVSDYNDYHYVLQSVEQRVRSFLEPVTGNYDGKGWNIGEFPNREKLYHVIKQEPKIRRINGVAITNKLKSQYGEKTVDGSEQDLFTLCVPVCGEITVDIEVG
jgi:hypothetical protein